MVTKNKCFLPKRAIYMVKKKQLSHDLQHDTLTIPKKNK
ncbi:MAG: hypothetical protein RL757_1690 [Bacteroidota bacterium]|jgi:hypothetical protein